MADTKKKRYRLNTGLSLADGTRLGEKDDVVETIPEESVGWLMKQGHIEEVKGKVSARNVRPDAGGDA